MTRESDVLDVPGLEEFYPDDWLDLNEEVGSDPQSPPSPLYDSGDETEAIDVSEIPVEARDYFGREIERRREYTRVWITAALLWIFGVTVIWVLYVVTFGDSAAWENTKEALQIVLPVEASLLGAAITFYFTSYRDR